MGSERSGVNHIRGFIGRYINRETLAERARGLRKALSRIPRSMFIEALALGITLVIAGAIRAMPIRWGTYLSEFDPYFQFRITERLVDEGFKSYFNWHDDLSWHYYGRNVATTSYPGLAITAAILYRFLQSIGLNLTLFEFTTYFPVIMGTVTVFSIYVFVKDVWGRGIALTSALLLAFSASHISRSVFGFFDDETVGILSMLLFFAFYLKAASDNRSWRSSVIYSILAGLALSYLTLSWGAFRYPMALVVLYTGVLVLLRLYRARLLAAYVITYGLQLLITSQLPYLGYSYLTEWPTLAVLAVLVLLLASEVNRRIRAPRAKVLALGSLATLLAASLAVLWWLGLTADIEAKFRAVLYPVERLQLPLIESVAEHRPATWASFFYEFGMVAPLGALGLVFAVQRRREGDIFLVLYGLTALYFAASLVRLTLILAPALSILASYAIVELGRPAVDILREAVIFPRRRARTITRVGREFGIAVFLVILLALMPGFWRAVQTAYAPVTIVTSSVPTVPGPGQEQRFQDWLEALAWMGENLPEDAVVFAWWDYGYWITALAERRTLADNGTINATQISIIAQTFLLNETMALPTLRRYGVTHIVIFVTPDLRGGRGQFMGYGEEGKWYWMARIGNNTIWENYNVTFREVRTDAQVTYYRIIQNSTGHVVADEPISEGQVPDEKTLLGMLIKSGVEIIAQPSLLFRQVFSSTNRFVHVFEVRYAPKTTLTLEPIPEAITFGDNVTLVGSLTDGLGKPIAQANVTLQYITNATETWALIDTVSTDVNGTFSYTWKPDAGDYKVRAWWEGKEGEYLPATSREYPLAVKKANATLNLTVTPIDITLGENITLVIRLEPPLSEGNFTIEYSLDNRTWIKITSGAMVNGTFTFTWTPPQEGTYYLKVTWHGTRNYNQAVSNIVTLVVRKE